jgi:DNA-binding beta-propeller fold protein YncE
VWPGHLIYNHMVSRNKLNEVFRMNFGQARVRLVLTGTVFSAAALVAGCGNNYRPVVTPVTPSGPAAQVKSYVAVVSAPSSTAAGIATIIDYSGDSVMAKSPIGLGPTAFTVDASGTSAFTLNSNHTLTDFPFDALLQEKNVVYGTLPGSAETVNVFSPSGGLWIADLNGDLIDYFTPTPPTFIRSLPVAPTPVMVMGAGSSGTRFFAISQGNRANGTPVSGPDGLGCNLSPATVGINGESDGIDVSSSMVSSKLPLGVCPVFAVMSSDNKRMFVLNRGSDTITVINAQNNTLDGRFDAQGKCIQFQSQAGQTVSCHPTLPLSLSAVTATGITPANGTTGMTNTAGPVHAEYNAATNQLIVADYDGGTISIIDVPLDEYGNDFNTYDSLGNITGGFGLTYTVKVGQTTTPYPASVTVLVDGSRAYTANQAEGTVSIVNLSSHTLEKTLAVTGYPRNVVSTQNSTTGKVYVASPNSPYLTVIRTDKDIVDTTILVEGNIVDARVSTTNGVSMNYNNVSRIPGFGQPCNLPPTVLSNATLTLEACRRQP